MLEQEFKARVTQLGKH